MTETNAIGAGIGGEDYVSHPGSSGRVSALLDLRVLDESGKELPRLERGELQIRGVSIIKGYWDREEANLEAFDGEWLRTGDVAYIDEEGYLYIVDRIKDLVIRGGENIGCAEVEAGLLAHPAGSGRHLSTRSPMTAWAKRWAPRSSLMTPLMKTSCADSCWNTSPDSRYPGTWKYRSEPLPRIASGKIDKRQLREAFVSALA